jgi:hypothetical protein
VKRKTEGIQTLDLNRAVLMISMSVVISCTFGAYEGEFRTVQ